MSLEGQEISLGTVSTGIVFYSPAAASDIQGGEDYLTNHYSTPEDVIPHLLKGTLVGFGTAEPGWFILRFHDGYPDEAEIKHCEFKLRLGLRCVGGLVCFRDLFDLHEWKQTCPPEQTLKLPDGYYHVTLCSDRPASGLLGDGQVIDIYLQPLPEFPRLKYTGIPFLLYDPPESEE
jgi:hypothetical protein